MRRREVIAGFGLAAFMPLPATAQALDRVRRLGLLMSYTENDQEGRERLAAFREALRDAGWVEGGNTRVDARWYAGDPEQAMVRARELVELAPDLLVVNGSPGVAALKRLTNTIPIVFVVVADPVGAGYVESLSRPGSNITGFSTFEPEIGGKWLEALKEAAPHIQRVGVVMDPNFPGFAALWSKIESVAPSSGLQAIAAYGRDGPRSRRPSRPSQVSLTAVSSCFRRRSTRFIAMQFLLSRNDTGCLPYTPSDSTPVTAGSWLTALTRNICFAARPPTSTASSRAPTAASARARP
jgi:hypothetical protein